MQKFVKILEKNAEWIALGIAGLWLLWVVWAYVLAPPTVEIDGEKVTAANIDDMIFDGPKKQLEQNINDGRVPTVPTVEYVASFDGRMLSKPVGTAVAGVWSHKPADPLKGGNLGPVAPQQDAVLVKVPAVKDVLTASGRSQVLLPPPPVDPARPAAPVAVQPVNAPVDKLWVVVSGLINHIEITKAFDEAKIPQFLAGPPTFLEVQLERREVLADGKFGQATRVPVLAMNRGRVMVVNDNGQQFEQEVDLAKDPDEYLDWAANANNQTTILQPPFYQVVAGDPWQPNIAGVAPVIDPNRPVNPDQPLVGPGQVDPQLLDPAQLLNMFRQFKTPKEQIEFRRGLTPQQRQILTRAIDEDDRQNRKVNQPQPPVRPGAGGPGNSPRPTMPERGGRPNQNNAADAELFREAVAQARGENDADRTIREMRDRAERAARERSAPTRGPGGGGALPPPRGIGGPVFEGGGFNQPNFAPGLAPDVNGNVPVWAHDETGVPGKTYQYRLRVVIRNPLYQTNGVAKNDDDAKVVAIPNDAATAWSEWSKGVQIPLNLKFWLASGAGGGNNPSVRFRVRKWEKGRLNISDPFTVYAGDVVGGVVNAPMGAAAPGVPVPAPVPGVAAGAEKVDFTTGWTVVDIRQVGSDTRVTLINDEGVTMTRFFKEDDKNPEFKDAPALPPVGPAIGGITN